MRMLVAAVLAAVPANALAEAPRCPAPTNLPAVRKGGDLTVTSPPQAPNRPFPGRLRAHVNGSLGKPHLPRDLRYWAGIEVPAFVPIALGTKELFLLDQVGDRYMALYRDPYGASSCGSYPDRSNCASEVRIYRCDGTQLAALPLAPYMSSATGLEIQDVQLDGDTLYFNEACQSYSKEQRGKCSALVAVDVATAKLRWRTKNLVSNNRFLVHGRYLVTGYGFTLEPSALFLVRASDGKVVAKQPLARVVYPGGNHDTLALEPDDVLRVGISEHPDDALLRIVGITTDHPRFEVIHQPAPRSNNYHPDGTPNPSWRGPKPPTLRPWSTPP